MNPKSPKTYVVVKTTTDPTGHMEIEVKAVIFGPDDQGTPPDVIAHRLKDRLNRMPKKDPMEVYIVRIAGDEGDGGSNDV